MARTSSISKKIYKEHLKLYRFLNNEFIFLEMIINSLKKELDNINSNPKNTFKFKVPKKGNKILSRRRKNDILNLINDQLNKELFSKNVIILISRIENHMQKCLCHVIGSFPQKLSILAGEKITITTEKFFMAENKEELLKEYIEQKSSDMMFESPKEYIYKFENILSIKIPQDIIRSYIEIKATRDVIIHNNGIINELYIKKASQLSRGKSGDNLTIDEKYYIHVVNSLKKFAGAIMSGIEGAYG